MRSWVGAVVLLGLVSAPERPSVSSTPQDLPAGQAGSIQAQQVIDTGELMDLFFDAPFKELKAAIARTPSNRKDWAAIYGPAARLAEGSNLLLFRNANRYTGDPEWPAHVDRLRKAASDLRSITTKGLTNIRADDYAAVKSAYPRVAEACNACHRDMDTEAKNIKP